MQSKAFEYLKNNRSNIVTSTYNNAIEINEVFKYFKIKSVVLPDFRANIYDDIRSFREEIFQLNNALYKIYTKNYYFISPINTILKKLPKKKYYKSFKIEIGDILDFNEIKEKFLYWGYEIVDIVSSKGEMSIKGNIFDIWPINSSYPIRLLSINNEIESIKIFDETTQKSIDETDEIDIIPAIAALEKEEYNNIISQIEKNDFKVFFKDFYSLGFWFLEREYLDEFVLIDDYKKEIEEYKQFNIEFNKNILTAPILDQTECEDFKAKSIKELIEISSKNIEILVKDEYLLEENSIEKLVKIKAPRVKVIKSDAIVNINCKEKIIVSLNKRESFKRKDSNIIIDELKKGDFVVHYQHGIGKFNGLKRIEILGKTGEFAEIIYANDDKLLLPVENLDKIEKYISNYTPTIDKLGGNFSRKLAKIKNKIFAMASDIIKTAAKREILTPIKLDYSSVDKFIKEAPFTHTEDQLKAINEIINDFKTKVMDRLLTGDVGFGKTEVAIVASYIIAKNSYQVAVIVPTTILVNQHYESFKERLKNYNIKIAKLDRFLSPKEKKRVIEEVEKGEIDILITTHAGFNINYKNLGLLIIDEEHKFGVKHKEKLKQISENIHTLYMSATPIPRTLNLALSKIKSISSLDKAPSNKKETKTFVKEFNKETIKEAILRELRRGGQIFYILNNISYLEIRKNFLLEILPNLRILTIHSKLTPNQIEKGFIDFINKEYDLMLTTTIVESGIHIPNVNSVIVENADKFGIADLHQIRGRVGRGKYEGYAYFLVEDKQKLTEEAKKRLIALEENSFLGSGKILAMKDLEIRGGGNILGETQSGDIKGIGYSMYIKLLEEELQKFSEKTTEENNTEIKLSIEAYLSDKIIKEDRLRLDLYRRLSKTKTIEEVYEIQREIIDRFGEIDTPTKNFLDKIKIKIMASNKGVKSISNYSMNISIVYSDKKIVLKAKSKEDKYIIEEILKFFENE